MSIQQILFATGAGGGRLLDTYAGAGAAYSMRLLRTAYVGSCLRVRRSSDSTEQDIGFVSGALDTAGMLSFVGANNGFVTKWYDQSGAGLDAAQTTAASQPQIVSSGAVIVRNSLPSMQFDGSNDYLISSAGLAMQAARELAIATVVQSLRTSVASEGIVALDRTGFDFVTGAILERRATALAITGGTGNNGNTTSAPEYRGSSGSNSNITALCNIFASMIGTGAGGVDLAHDGVSLTLGLYSGSMPTTNFMTTGTGNHFLMLGIRSGNFAGTVSDPWQGYMSETVIWLMNQGSNKAGIYGNQKAYFGTP